jgi:glycine oxidase
LVSPDVIVIGAGAIGTSIGYQLARAGRRVMIFDRGQVGREATGASAGMILAAHGRGTPEPFATLATESARLFAPLAEELKDRTGTDIGYRRVGRLQVAFDEVAERHLRAERGWQVDHGAIVPWLDPASALDLEPALHPNIRAAIYYDDESQLLPLAFAQALARAAADLGAIVREGAAVDRLVIEGDRVAGVALGDERVHADEVVIANGSWVGAWSVALELPIPVRPMRGQLVALRTAGTALRTVIAAGDGYALTKPDGSTIVGTTVEDVGFDARPTASAIATLLTLAPQLAPRLADATVAGAWAGLRPGTPDGMPLIGRLPRWRGVTLAGGHFRNGILLAPITGELVADLIARRRPRLALDAFDPGRFLVRAA